jgi:hypothetical protein
VELEVVCGAYHPPGFLLVNACLIRILSNLIGQVAKTV